MVLKVFMSYSTDDKQLAGRVKEELSFYGVDVFLAHEDLRPSVQWQDEIIRQVEACDVFVSLHTGSFKLSDWTDQESGMAMAIKGKVIIPINVTRNPHGFLGRYQAHKLDSREEKLQASCKRLIVAMRERHELRAKLQEAFIRSFINSRSYLDANRRSDILDDFGPYDIGQVAVIIQGSIENSQVYEATTARRKLKQFYSRYEKNIDTKMKARFSERF